MFNKKGSLNLSIQMIVIVVIAFVVLGLGLGFVRSQFGSIEESSTQVQDAIKQDLMDQLRRSNITLSFPAQTVKVDAGGSSVQSIGIKNVKDNKIQLEVQFFVKATEEFEGFIPDDTKEFSTKKNDGIKASILWDDQIQYLPAGETNVIQATITAPDKQGNYLYKIVLMDVEKSEVYAAKTFFINTQG